MFAVLKPNKLCKFYKKNVLKNVMISKVIPHALKSTEDSSETLPLPNLQRLSNRNLKENAINNFCVPTSPSCESVLAGNPQAVGRRDLIRHDIIKKWEQKTKISPRNNSALLLSIALLGEINKK